MRRSINNYLIVNTNLSNTAMAHSLNTGAEPAADDVHRSRDIVVAAATGLIGSSAGSLMAPTILFPRCDRAEARQPELRNGLHQTRRRRGRDD